MPSDNTANSAKVEPPDCPCCGGSDTIRNGICNLCDADMAEPMVPRRWFEEQVKLVQKAVRYDRDVLTTVFVYHYRKEDSSCGCGWGEDPRQKGLSHPEHVADMYEQAIKEGRDA
jgi:hypothetical protein